MTATLIQIQIPFAPEKPMLSAWLYAAWLAYPKEEDASKRKDMHEALAAFVHKSQGKNAPHYLQRFKKSKAESVTRRGLIRAERQALAAWVFLKHLDEGIKINAACDLATIPAGRVDYDAATAPDTFEPVWPWKGLRRKPESQDCEDAYIQATPDTNVRRAFYDARPILPMFFALPILPYAMRAAICPDLEGIGLPKRTMREAVFSDDWIWIACRDANRIAERWKDLPAFDSGKIIIPSANSSIF